MILWQDFFISLILFAVVWGAFSVLAYERGDEDRRYLLATSAIILTVSGIFLVVLVSG